MINPAEAKRFFSVAWRRCHLLGWCDQEGGAESHRVEAAWTEAGRPYDVWEFIRLRANLPAPRAARPDAAH